MTHVLMLHRVMPEQPTAFGRSSCYRLRGTSLTPQELDALLDHGPIRPLDDVVAALSNRGAVPPGCVLTFDDGYREWVDVVGPTLARYGAVATFFVCRAFQATAPAVHPVDAFYWLLDHARRERFELQLPDGSVERGSLATDKDKAALVTGRLKRLVVTNSPEMSDGLLTVLADAVEAELPHGLAHSLYPPAEGLRSLAASGHALGGHGVTHRHLTSLSASEAFTEIEASLDWAKQLSRATKVPFAYPDGAVDEQVTRAVSAAGATAGVTCTPGRVHLDADLFLLPREFVTPEHPWVRSRD